MLAWAAAWAWAARMSARRPGVEGEREDERVRLETG
jgi:hypothetical protein